MSAAATVVVLYMYHPAVFYCLQTVVVKLLFRIEFATSTVQCVRNCNILCSLCNSSKPPFCFKLYHCLKRHTAGYCCNLAVGLCDSSSKLWLCVYETPCPCVCSTSMARLKFSLLVTRAGESGLQETWTSKSRNISHTPVHHYVLINCVHADS